MTLISRLMLNIRDPKILSSYRLPATAHQSETMDDPTAMPSLSTVYPSPLEQTTRHTYVTRYAPGDRSADETRISEGTRGFVDIDDGKCLGSSDTYTYPYDFPQKFNLCLALSQLPQSRSFVLDAVSLFLTFVWLDYTRLFLIKNLRYEPTSSQRSSVVPGHLSLWSRRSQRNISSFSFVSPVV